MKNIQPHQRMSWQICHWLDRNESFIYSNNVQVWYVVDIRFFIHRTGRFCWVGRRPNLFFSMIRCRENWSSGENRAGCADLVALPAGSFIYIQPQKISIYSVVRGKFKIYYIIHECLVSTLLTDCIQSSLSCELVTQCLVLISKDTAWTAEV